jgi:uncharacterized membrane protein
MNSGAGGAQLAVAPGQNSFGEVQAILAQRCYLCHGEQVQMKNVRLDSPSALKSHAQQVYQQVVVSKLMPMNNATGITDAERLAVKRWFEAGAKTD